MPFDQTTYDAQVIEPLRGRRGGLRDDDDLFALYAVDADCADPQRLRERLKAVRSYWNQKSAGRTTTAQVCTMLIAADDRLRRTAGVDLESPAWWQAMAQRRQRRQDEALVDLVAYLTTAYTIGDRITRTQRAAIVDQFSSLTEAQVDDALRRAHLSVVDDVDLPASSGLGDLAYRLLLEKLAEIGGTPTVVHLLHPDIDKPFSLVTAFAIEGTPGAALDRATLDRQLAKAEQAADGPGVRARKAALAMLRTGLDRGADLRTLALFQIVEDLREAKSRRYADQMLVKLAQQRGLAALDAALVVASLPVGIDATRSSPGQRIRDLLEAGQLRAAEQALSGLGPSDAEYAEAKAVVETARQRVDQLIEAATAALDGRREDEAARRFDDAIRIAGDDEALAARRQRVPLPPPRDALARPVHATVRLSWAPPSPAVSGVSYRVVRAEDRMPTGPDDGDFLATTVDNGYADGSPPIARRLRYAIFASLDGQTWSRGEHVEALVTPPVTNVRLEIAEDRVVGSWKRHTSAIAVRVSRTAGRAPRDQSEGLAVEASMDAFVDRAIDAGTDYFYAFIAVYLNARHQEVESEPVVVAASPQAQVTAVDGLSVTPVSFVGGNSRIRLSWPTGAGGPVRLRYAERRPVWDPGESIPLSQLDLYGKEIVGARGQEGTDTVVEADVPVGQYVYVAFAISGDAAVVGRAVSIGTIEPIRQLEHRRVGGEILLSWLWPDGTGMVEVVWTTAERGTTVRRMTKAQYTHQGGCRVPVGRSGGSVRICGVSVGAAGEAMSPPVRLTVEGRPIEVSYRIERLPGLRNRLSRQRLLRLQADADCDGVEVLVIASAGDVLPLHPEQGRPVNRYVGLTLRADVPERFEIEVPDGLRGPYWIRCFAVAPDHVTVVDPPMDNLKVMR